MVRRWFDRDGIAARVLRPHQEIVAPAQRRRLASLLGQLIEASVWQRLPQLPPELSMKCRGRAKVRRALVRCSASVEGRSESFALQLCRGPKGGWLIYDMRTAEVQLVRDFQQQIGRLLQRIGYDGLVRRMERKVAELRQLAAAPRTVHRR